MTRSAGAVRAADRPGAAGARARAGARPRGRGGRLERSAALPALSRAARPRARVVCGRARTRVWAAGGAGEARLGADGAIALGARSAPCSRPFGTCGRFRSARRNGSSRRRWARAGDRSAPGVLCSREKISEKEKDALALAASVLGVQIGAQSVRALAGFLHLIPEGSVGVLAIDRMSNSSSAAPMSVRRCRRRPRYWRSWLPGWSTRRSAPRRGPATSGARTIGLSRRNRRSSRLEQLARQVPPPRSAPTSRARELSNHEQQIEQARGGRRGHAQQVHRAKSSTNG